VAVLSQLRHPNLLLYMGCAVRPHRPLCIVSELFPGGSLHTYLHGSVLDGSGRAADGDVRPLTFARDIARGLLYLHTRGLTHGDLKSQNVLVRGGQTVIADFGLATTLRGPGGGGDGDDGDGAGGGGGGGGVPAAPIGTPCTMAPEVMEGDPYTPAADAFSFGVLLWELHTRREPWAGMRPVQIMYAVGVEGERLPLLPPIPPRVAALCRACWAEAPAERPDFGRILTTLDACGG